MSNDLFIIRDALVTLAEESRKRTSLLEESVALQLESLKLAYEQATLLCSRLAENPERPGAGKITEVEKP